MQHFSNGPAFEKAVFGHSAGGNLFRRFGRDLTTFGDDLNLFVQSSGVEYPPTQIGFCLYHQGGRQLESLSINPEGLAFIPSTDTSIDLYGIDGLFYLPSLFPHFVSVDAFNTDSTKIWSRRDEWIDACRRKEYSELNFQYDLFLYKKGALRWEADKEKAAKEDMILVEPSDLRLYAVDTGGRWKNHFTLIPRHVQNYERRRDFARMVAGYFAKVAEASSHGNMAPQSH